MSFCIRGAIFPCAATSVTMSSDNSVMSYDTLANDEVERRGLALPTNEADLSQSSIHSLVHRRHIPEIARTDC
jgi:hypothetical protein